MFNRIYSMPNDAEILELMRKREKESEHFRPLIMQHVLRRTEKLQIVVPNQREHDRLKPIIERTLSSVEFAIRHWNPSSDDDYKLKLEFIVLEDTELNGLSGMFYTP